MNFAQVLFYIILHISTFIWKILHLRILFDKFPIQHRAKKKVVVHIKDDIPTQKLRLHLSEHPFGTVKWYHGAHYLLCKGIEKATAELGLSFLAYNLKRAINMVGTKKLLAAIKA